MIQRSDLRLLIGALVALVIVSGVIVLTRGAQGGTPLSVRSEREVGALALRSWLERSGYDVREVLTTPTGIDDVDVLFILNNDWFTGAYDNLDGQALRVWVENGNTLIIGTDSNTLNPLLEPFGVEFGFMGRWGNDLVAGSPTLLTPPLNWVRFEGLANIRTEREDVTVHIFDAGYPILVSFPQGEGRVWMVGSAYPFTNEGIQKGDNGALIANMLAHVPQGATIGFDERLHGFTESPNTFNGWLFGTAPGWGVVLGVVLTMAYLGLRGRRFGQAIPLPEARLRREPVEYIQAMATLFRRTGQREAMMRHYNGQLRRRLSERYGVDPKLGSAELVKRVVYADPSVDEVALRDLLMRLSRADVSEHELIGAASDVDAYTKKMI